MGKRDGYIFVLWADQFEEDVTTIFVTGPGEAAAGEGPDLPTEAVTIYPDKGELMAFARRLADRL